MADPFEQLKAEGYSDEELERALNVWKSRQSSQAPSVAQSVTAEVKDPILDPEAFIDSPYGSPQISVNRAAQEGLTPEEAMSGAVKETYPEYLFGGPTTAAGRLTTSLVGVPTAALGSRVINYGPKAANVIATGIGALGGGAAELLSRAATGQESGEAMEESAYSALFGAIPSLLRGPSKSLTAAVEPVNPAIFDDPRFTSAANVAASTYRSPYSMRVLREAQEAGQLTPAQVRTVAVQSDAADSMLRSYKISKEHPLVATFLRYFSPVGEGAYKVGLEKELTIKLPYIIDEIAESNFNRPSDLRTIARDKIQSLRDDRDILFRQLSEVRGPVGSPTEMVGRIDPNTFSQISQALDDRLEQLSSFELNDPIVSEMRSMLSVVSRSLGRKNLTVSPEMPEIMSRDEFTNTLMQRFMERSGGRPPGDADLKSLADILKIRDMAANAPSTFAPDRTLPPTAEEAQALVESINEYMRVVMDAFDRSAAGREVMTDVVKLESGVEALSVARDAIQDAVDNALVRGLDIPNPAPIKDNSNRYGAWKAVEDAATLLGRKTDRATSFNPEGGSIISNQLGAVENPLADFQGYGSPFGFSRPATALMRGEERLARQEALRAALESQTTQDLIGDKFREEASLLRSTQALGRFDPSEYIRRESGIKPFFTETAKAAGAELSPKIAAAEYLGRQAGGAVNKVVEGISGQPEQGPIGLVSSGAAAMSPLREGIPSSFADIIEAGAGVNDIANKVFAEISMTSQDPQAEFQRKIIANELVNKMNNILNSTGVSNSDMPKERQLNALLESLKQVAPGAFLPGQIGAGGHVTNPTERRRLIRILQDNPDTYPLAAAQENQFFKGSTEILPDVSTYFKKNNHLVNIPPRVEQRQ